MLERERRSQGVSMINRRERRNRSRPLRPSADREPWPTEAGLRLGFQRQLPEDAGNSSRIKATALRRVSSESSDLDRRFEAQPTHTA